MKHAKRRRWIILLSLVTVLTLGIVISLLVLGSPERDFTATAYSDLVRFQAAGVATLQVQIYDLSGKKVWDSGVVLGGIVDWGRNNDFGERLAYGAYIYSAQGWNAQGDLIFQKNGKLALMPGDEVQLQAAPTAVGSESKSSSIPEKNTGQVRPMTYDHTGDWTVSGRMGIGTEAPSQKIEVNIGSSVSDGIAFSSNGTGNTIKGRFGFTSPNDFQIRINRFFGDLGWDDSTKPAWALRMSSRFDDFSVWRAAPGGSWSKLIAVSPSSVGFSVNVGIGTTTPTATLEVHGSAANLLALYDPVAPTNPKFRVEKTGAVRADGAYYGASFNTGSADVAERINTSEWVEPGNVVEIDPEHPGFFRKSSSPYSTKVAGIISTSPGVILGNSFGEAMDDWEDNRPMLAVTGRVPCKVSTENGPIEIGDLLVSSSTPGIAMKGKPGRTMGAVVGKAMEPLEEEAGVIMVQVMLR